jgi:hypothetical protein
MKIRPMRQRLMLLVNWLAEDETNNAEEIQTAEQEISDFKGSLNENRTRPGEPLVYP